jgi:methyl-accepting chemotaxis protein
MEAQNEIEQNAKAFEKLSIHTEKLMEKTDHTKNSLNTTKEISQKALNETTKINTHVRLLIDSVEGLLKESEISQETAKHLKQISNSLKEIVKSLQSKTDKFNV